MKTKSTSSRVAIIGANDELADLKAISLASAHCPLISLRHIKTGKSTDQREDISVDSLAFQH